jgi:hypothetical protein
MKRPYAAINPMPKIIAQLQAYPDNRAHGTNTGATVDGVKKLIIKARHGHKNDSFFYSTLAFRRMTALFTPFAVFEEKI